jgi:carbamoyl-phosphate synthase large subunit
MPLRTDVKKLLLIGSGPIIIGQAAEFDYSGTQAIQSLKEEGYEVVVMNSNPATIQTESGIADRIYVEPVTPEFAERVIKAEKIQGILSGMGGQTALNLCAALHDDGVLKKYGVKLLGTGVDAIKNAEDRDAFRGLMQRLGEPIPKSVAVNSVDEAKNIVKDLGGYPVIVRAAFTLGGAGSGIVYNPEELERVASLGMHYSRIHQVLVEECVLGWKEFEYEVMRDGVDTCITVCNMENIDPMGIHTGESIVVAPAQTLSDEEHQMLRSAALRIIRALKIEGGCNVQFALSRETGEYRVIEVNPRVSRSSALASKATGYPIARVAAKIAVGLSLSEIRNRVTGKTIAAFEPMLDYVVVKIPRWPFDKFKTAEREIGTQMKSTGEVMAIGRSFESALMKAIRSLDQDVMGFEQRFAKGKVAEVLAQPTDERLFCVAEAIRLGYKDTTIADLSGWDIFFIRKIRGIVELEERLKKEGMTPGLLRIAKDAGFTDEYIASLSGSGPDDVRNARKKSQLEPAYRMVDTCAGEFESATPYYYSTYSEKCEIVPIKDRKKVLMIGSGPIRIGQGIEFDCCCVHGVFALREEGVFTIVINNNPETVSTDFDISDRLYFEPLTFEDVMNVIEKEEPDGVIVQFGGQTAINLTLGIESKIGELGLKTKILGTPPKSIDIAEDRDKFELLLSQAGIKRPEGGTGHSYEDVHKIAERLGYPMLIRPSYVLGGRGMEIVHSDRELREYMTTAVKISKSHPVLLDKYLTNALEIDVDAVSDGKDTWIGGVLEHVEYAGVHSGDASMAIPPQSLTDETIDRIEDITKTISQRLGIIGLVNLQLAVKDGEVYVLEANPRASRTVPFISKVLGVPLAKLATRLMLGHKLEEYALPSYREIRHIAVKSSVFPFDKIKGVDTILGPEMKSTGEVMGISGSFGIAFYKAQLAAGSDFNLDRRTVFVTVRDDDKPLIYPLCKRLHKLGIKFYGSKGTANFLRDNGIPCETAYQISEAKYPDALGLMRRGEIDLVVNTPSENTGAKRDGYMMRRVAVDIHLPYITTVACFRAAVEAIEAITRQDVEVKSLNSYHLDIPPGRHGLLTSQDGN